MVSGGDSLWIFEMQDSNPNCLAHTHLRRFDAQAEQVFPLLLGLLVGFCAGSTFAADPQPPITHIEGLWSGADTNDPLPSAFLCIKLATNGQGAFISGGFVAIPGTFTYTVSPERIDYVTNSTVQLHGSLRYDSATDSLIYQTKPVRASRVREQQGPVILSRDTDELKNTLLGLVLGAPNEEQVMARLKPVLQTLRGATNYDDAIARLKPVIDAITNRVGGPTKPMKPAENPPKSGSTTNRLDSPRTNP